MQSDLQIDLLRRFTYHEPTEGQPEQYAEIRAAGLDLAEVIGFECPDSPERAQALNKIDEAVMWANAAIARNA